MSGRIRIDPTSRLPIYPPRLAPGSQEGAPQPRAETRDQGYVELAVRSNFSFLQAASPPEEIVQLAADQGYGVIGLTDRDGLYGMVRAHEEAKRQNLRLVVGSELTLDPEEGTARGAPRALLVHVENHAGYTNLCRILTESHRRHPKGTPQKPSEDGTSPALPERGQHQREDAPKNLFAGVPLSFVCENAAGLWAMAGPGSTQKDVGVLRDAFGARASLAVHRHLDGNDRARLREAKVLSSRSGVPLCATNAVRYARREQKPIYDVLHCIREGITLDEAGRALAPNTEACLKSKGEMARIFADHPSFLARTRVIAEACRFSMAELRYKFPCELEEPAFPGETPDQALRRLTLLGAKDRYGDRMGERVLAQIEKELALIAKLDVAPYFLSVRSIIDIARRRDILCQGRGSAANSAVCFCLGITAVDPARSNLLFERFLSAERAEPPDIDVDFEHERREEVIQEIYQRYGRDRAAMVSEIICYRGKSALREVGKVFGLSLEQIDRLSTVVTHWDPSDVGEISTSTSTSTRKSAPSDRLRDAGLDSKDDRVRQVVLLSKAIYGTPRHLSIHVGGFILSAAPLVEVAPIEPATMADRTIVPWDKDDIDTLGFFKVDVLGLGMLTALRKALDFVAPKEGAATAIDRLAMIPAEDPRVYDALCKADTVGVFQIESRAQMSMLPRLLPRTFYDLVVEVAIVRPGPIQGGMIHPYLRRRNGEESPDAPHPLLAPVLERTLGVPLFQEQVMQLAIVGAGYSGGEADQLRRDMAAWKKNGRLEQHRERLIRGFAARGVSLEFAERLYKQIQGFGEYGFPESHAASFALLVYASSWIKVHHPAAFAAALVNSQPMGFYSPSTLLQDAQRHGVLLYGICIHRSDWDCTLEAASTIRVGLRQVRGLGEESGKRIEAARARGLFTSIEDLSNRAHLKKNELEALAEAGALAPLMPEGQKGRREAIWKVHAPRAPGLFRGHDLGDEAPSMPALTRAEQLVLDYERTGLSVNDHPMRIVRPSLPKAIKSSIEVQTMPHGARVTGAGLVICRQRPQTASGVVFVTMEDEAGFINVILYARIFEQFRHVATTSTLLVVEGKIEREGEVVYIVAQRLSRMAMPAVPTDPQRSNSLEVVVPEMSRDFH